MKNKGFVDSLRAIADFYEMHPDFPFPYSGEIRCYVSCVPGEAKKQIATFVDYGGAHIEEKEALVLAQPVEVEVLPIVPSDLLSVIARVVADPHTDIEKMERLLAMHERITAEQRKQAFATALSL